MSTQDSVHVEFFGSMALWHHYPKEHSVEVSRYRAGALGAQECPTCRDERLD